jgi:hypothetical protein
MEDAAHDLERGQNLPGKNVAKERQSQNRPGQQCSMPSLGYVVRLVQHDEALNDGALEKAHLGTRGHPREDLRESNRLSRGHEPGSRVPTVIHPATIQRERSRAREAWLRGCRGTHTLEQTPELGLPPASRRVQRRPPILCSDDGGAAGLVSDAQGRARRETDMEAISPSDAAMAVEPRMQRTMPQTSAV